MKFLGIDVGTGGTRALVVDTDGRVTASATVEHVHFACAQTGWAEQDPRDWWRAATLAIRQILAEQPAEKIGGVGPSRQMHVAVPLSAPGQRLSSSVD